MADKPTREELIGRAADIVPVLRERAAEAERERRIPQATIDDLHANGLWRILRPSRYGGYVTDTGTMFEVIAELGRGCGSTAWVYANLISHNWMLPYWPAACVKAVWDDNPDALIGSALAFPSGKLEPADGGFRLSGRWPFASGVDASNWMMMGGMLRPEDGPPKALIGVVPIDAIEVHHDTWHVAGLSGTGSKDVSCENLFVPAHMVYDFADARTGFSPGTEELEGDAYRLPLFATFPLVVAMPMLGMARGAYDHFVDGLKTQVARYGGARVAEYTTVQLKLAEAGVAIDSAHLLCREVWVQAHALVAANDRPDLETRARWRRDVAHAARLAVQAVDLIHTVAGAAADRLDNPLQRHFRDIHAAIHQIQLVWDINAPDFGRVAVGLPPANPAL
ncbi:MAG: acyl-CoA dehydrogenase family protein [Alphaproteobacteria bacterium]